MFSFLQTYGTWIFFGIALLFMFFMHSGRGHGMGGGRGMGHQHGGGHEQDSPRAEPSQDKAGSGQTPPASPVAAGHGHGGHGAGCH